MRKRGGWIVAGGVLVGAVALALLLPHAWRPAQAPPTHPAADDPVEGLVEAEAGPVEGAVVRFKGSKVETSSDQQGRFRLPRRGGSRLTAWKEGYLIAGIEAEHRPLTLRLHPLPAEDNPDYEWVDPRPDPAGEHNCGNCHGDIYREWSATGHANSATNHHFRDLLEGTARGGKKAGWSLADERPSGQAVCASCHAPAIPAGDPALFDLTQVRGVAAQGVHCDYCHKVAGPELGEPGLTHGRYLLRLLRPRQGQLFFGPLDDVDRGEDAYSPFYRDSRYCAVCHEGVVFGVHVYSTYSEWQQSPAGRRGQSCQLCHMQPTGKLGNLAPGKGGIDRDPWTLGNHTFFAGSQLDMLRRSLRLGIAWQRGEPDVVVSLQAEQVGHRVPTGFIDRHLVLRVEGLDGRGTLIPVRRGQRLPGAAGPGWAGQPGHLFGRILEDEQGQSPAPFWRAAGDPIDTRLEPGRAERYHFRFVRPPVYLCVRVVHRRFWAEVASTKGWADTDLVVIERMIRPGPQP